MSIHGLCSCRKLTQKQASAHRESVMAILYSSCSRQNKETLKFDSFEMNKSWNLLSAGTKVYLRSPAGAIAGLWLWGC